jgi:hypothetical protein
LKSLGVLAIFFFALCVGQFVTIRKSTVLASTG